MDQEKKELFAAVDSLSADLQEERIKSSQLHRAATGMAGASYGDQNLIEWQLDLSKELELVGHQLRGHVIERDKEGNEYWAEPKMVITNDKGEKEEVIDEERILLNERGAQEIEKIIRNYLNRNTLLSNYDEPTIKNRLMQFADRLRRFIFLNYEEFGLTTDYKMKHFEMLVMNITDMVESAYYRALHGGERESLRTARQVTQIDNPRKEVNYAGITGGQQQKSRWNPSTWLKP